MCNSCHASFSGGGGGMVETAGCTQRPRPGPSLIHFTSCGNYTAVAGRCPATVHFEHYLNISERALCPLLSQAFPRAHPESECMRVLSHHNGGGAWSILFCLMAAKPCKLSSLSLGHQLEHGWKGDSGPPWVGLQLERC